MNLKKYKEKLHLELNSYNIDISFLRKWYKEILVLINIAAARNKLIKHPRHIGDNSEDELIKVLKDIIPEKYKIAKGYALTSWSAKSREQDVIIYDSSIGGNLCKTEGISYIPLESISSSIEVKSNLTLPELRKSLLNCISIKKLAYKDFSFQESPKRQIFYGLFAYSSNLRKDFVDQLNKILEDIPESLRPNMIYIHDKGLYLPTAAGAIVADLKTILTAESPYKLFPVQIKEQEDAQALLLFLCSILNHCASGEDEAQINYYDYLLSPIMYEQKLSKENNEKLPEHFINSRAIWSEDKFNSLAGFSVICKKCGIENHFAYPPITSQKVYKTMKDSFLKNKIFFYEDNQSYHCPCGALLTVEDSDDFIK